jgi:hypothetical protein
MLVPGVDQRSTWVRRCRDLIAEHVADKGGDDSTSAAERSIIRRASVLTVELEIIERKFAQAHEAGKDADLATLETYTRVANGMRRLLEAIGLQRRPRDVGPSLLDVMAEEGEP